MDTHTSKTHDDISREQDESQETQLVRCMIKKTVVLISHAKIISRAMSIKDHCHDQINETIITSFILTL